MHEARHAFAVRLNRIYSHPAATHGKNSPCPNMCLRPWVVAVHPHATPGCPVRCSPSSGALYGVLRVRLRNANMRRDVKNVVSERPKGNRTGLSKTPRHKHPLVDVQGERIDEDSDHVRRKRQKMRSYQTNMLERFLLHRVGRPWSKVYSEVCAVTDSRSFQGDEVRRYLKNLVETQCWFDGKQLMSFGWRARPVPVRGLYVHPGTGLLLRNDG
jgi:hypothetical protein